MLAGLRDLSVLWDLRVPYFRDNWAVNPINPKSSLSYTAEETGLPQEVNSHGQHKAKLDHSETCSFADVA